VWVVAGGAVALSSLGNVNDDARQAVGVASVAGPLLGAWAALLMGRLADRSAGVVLMLSAVLTPTYFAYVLNLPALLVGAVLAVAGRRVLRASDSSQDEFGSRLSRRASGRSAG
jgi:hypothetical protein